MTGPSFVSGSAADDDGLAKRGKPVPRSPSPKAFSVRGSASQVDIYYGSCPRWSLNTSSKFSFLRGYCLYPGELLPPMIEPAHQ